MKTAKLAAFAALIVLIALVASPVRADDNSRPGVETLKGLHGVQVVIEDMNDDIIQDGLTKTMLQNNVENQLKQAGITVMDDDAWKNDPDHPYLYIRVNSLKSSDGQFYAYSLDIELIQQATLQNGSIATLAQTWETGSIGIVRSDSVPSIADRVTANVAEFVSDFNSQNPQAQSKKPAPAQKHTQVASR